MIRDPLYREIIDALSQPLDRDLFEECAVDLLRQVYPTLVPIPGGSDSGMDGAIADPNASPFPLVCTTGADVIGNLTRSLNTYKDNGGIERRAVSVTSQALSATRRNNLFRRARELGFELIQVHEQRDIADRLYRNPAWCRELLGVTGDRPALSAVPLNSRPTLGEPLVGRDEDVSWLMEIAEDRLLVGQPGIGKTAVLKTLVDEGNALFVVDTDLGRIRNALRAEQPRVLIIDDAHQNLSLISELQHLREYLVEEFLIVAATWPGAKDAVAHVLNLPRSAIRSLELLTRDQIVEVITQAGLHGPNALVRTIVDQAEGRPGLAITLVNMCLRGDIRGVALGETLSRDIQNTIEPFGGQESTQFLAAFALGGDGGITIRSVAEVFGVPQLDVHRQMSGLASAGIVTEVQHYDDNQAYLVIRPPFLRYALVRDIFFNGPIRLPYKPFLTHVWSQAATTLTLAQAFAVGASINRQELEELLERTDSVSAWKTYASLGEQETIATLNARPNLEPSFAKVALQTAPSTVLPLLFEQAIGDTRPLAQTPEHPLRQIRDWVQDISPGTKVGVRRRQVLINGAGDWLENGGDDRVVVHALSIALLPGFESYSPDPGSGMTIHIKRGLLSADEIRAIGELWPHVLQCIEKVSKPDWRRLVQTVEEWVYSNRGSHTPLPDNLIKEMEVGVLKMLSDIAILAASEPGVLYRIRELAADAALTIKVVVDPVFELLYGGELTENWAEVEANRARDIHDLAANWSAAPIESVVLRIVSLEESAETIEHLRYRRTPLLCETLANKASQPETWVKTLFDTSLGYDLMAPFLKKIAESKADNWEQSVADCLDSRNFQPAAIQVILSLPAPPTHLINRILEIASDYAYLIHQYCLHDQVSDAGKRHLLLHSDENVAGTTATAIWGTSRDDLLDPEFQILWRNAIVHYADRHDPWLSDILRNDGVLAYDWLQWQVGQRSRPQFLGIRSAADAAISTLDNNARRRIMSSIRENFYDPEFIAQLVGDDPNLYESLLEIPELREYWFAPLGGTLRPTWAQLAKVALRRGISPQEIVSGAPFGLSVSSSGRESAYWDSKIAEFRQMLEHEDSGIRDVGQRGVEVATEYRENAIARERNEAVFG